MLGAFGTTYEGRNMRMLIEKRLLRFSKEVTTLLVYVKNALETQDLPTDRILPLLFRRLRTAHKDLKFYLSRLFTKEVLNEKIKQHRENLRSFGEAFVAFLGGTDLQLKDAKGSWLNDYNRSLKNKTKELRSEIIKRVT